MNGQEQQPRQKAAYHFEPQVRLKVATQKLGYSVIFISVTQDENMNLLYKFLMTLSKLPTLA